MVPSTFSTNISLRVSSGSTQKIKNMKESPLVSFLSIWHMRWQKKALPHWQHTPSLSFPRLIRNLQCCHYTRGLPMTWVYASVIISKKFVWKILKKWPRKATFSIKLIFGVLMVTLGLWLGPVGSKCMVWLSWIRRRCNEVANWIWLIL